MKTMGIVGLALATLCAGATATPAASDMAGHYSGTVVTIDRLRDVIVVAEMRRWDPATEEASVTRRHIYFTALTDFTVYVRSNVGGKYAGDFGELQVDVVDLAPGDTVTAECVRAGEALVALRIAVADTHIR
jgi:hypothetical protein